MNISEICIICRHLIIIKHKTDLFFSIGIVINLLHKIVILCNMHKSIKIQSFNLTKNHVFISMQHICCIALHARSVKQVKNGLKPLIFGCFSHTGKYILSCYGYLRNEPRGVTQAMSGGRAELPEFVQSAQKIGKFNKNRYQAPLFVGEGLAPPVSIGCGQSPP